MTDNDDVHGSRSEFERYEHRYGFNNSSEPMIDGVPLSKLLATANEENKKNAKSEESKRDA